MDARKFPYKSPGIAAQHCKEASYTGRFTGIARAKHAIASGVLVARTLLEDACDGMCRHGFQHVLDVVAQMLRILKAGGKETVVDMDNLLKREALDVIGECPPRCSMMTPTMSTLTS